MPTDDLADPRRESARDRELALALAITPVVVGVGALVLPAVQVEEHLASAIVFGGATLCALSALSVACARARGARAHWAALVVSVAIVLTVGISRATSASAATLVDGALVAFAWAVGSAVGRRVEHPGHLLPACVVVACADLASTLSPSGPTHAIAESTRVLPLVAVSFPVPGTSAFAPALGVGDLVFIALLLGATSVHALPYLRTVGLCAVGIALAGAASAWLGSAVPALVTVSLAVVLGVKATRAVRPRERRLAQGAMFVAVCLAGAALVARAFA